MSAAIENDESRSDTASERKAERTEDSGRGVVDPSFFNLSGGILREGKAPYRGSIDDLLSKLMSQSTDTRLSKHVDRNLDYLHTCLQLDMIRMIAEEIQPADRGEDSSRDRVVRTLRGSPIDALRSSTALE